MMPTVVTTPPARKPRQRRTPERLARLARLIHLRGRSRLAYTREFFREQEFTEAAERAKVLAAQAASARRAADEMNALATDLERQAAEAQDDLELAEDRLNAVTPEYYAAPSRYARERARWWALASQGVL